MRYSTLLAFVATAITSLYLASCVGCDTTRDHGIPVDPNQTYDSARLSFMVDSVPFDMILVKGGTFIMGNDSDRNNKPCQVTLSSYYIGEAEVTRQLWFAVMGHEEGQPADSLDPQLPIDCVSWDRAMDFIEKLNEITGRKFHLPTEAQWQFASQGGCQSKGYRYSGSDNADEVAWFSYNNEHELHPVKTKRANELGIYDMTGNVAEWCYDRAGARPEGPLKDPVGAAKSRDGYNDPRVIRGGELYSIDDTLPPVNVFKEEHNSQWTYSGGIWLGFRLAL